VLTLLSALGNSKACAERLSEIVKAADEASSFVAQADKLRAEIAAERAALAAERDKQAEQIAADRKEFETQCNHRDQMINDRAKETERLNEAAKAARAEAERIRDDLKIRIERVKSAAA
jgi:hypothetical protein